MRLDLKNPLTDTDRQNIDDALENIKDAMALAEKATRSDIPVDEQIATLKEQEAQLRKIKQNFFPNG